MSAARRLAFWPVMKREVFSFFVSPMAYVLLTVWLLLSGLTFYILCYYQASQPMSAGGPQDSPLVAFFGGTTLFYLPMLIFVPLITMRLLAEERSRGTIEVLLTAPVGATSVVIGKYLAAVTVWIAMWVPTLLYVWLTSRYGDVDLGVTASSYAGVIGVGVYYIAIGTLMSAVAPNQIVSAALTFMALAALFIVGLGQFVFGEEYREVFAFVSIWGHMEAFSRGVIDSRYVLFDVTVAIGMLALAVGAVRARGKELRWASPEGRWPVYNIALILALLVQVNYLSYRHYERWDWTEHDIYTLSERTEVVLGDLDRDVEMWILLSEGEEGFAELRNLLERYTALSERITVHFVDPDRDPDAYREVAMRFDLGAMMSGEMMRSDVAAVVAAGERHWEVTRDDLISRSADPFQEEDTIELNVEGERAITGALVELTDGEASTICVTIGHGEYSTTGAQRSLAGFAAEMGRENLEMVDIVTRGREEITTADCAAVAIVGPELAFTDAEVDVLRAYVRSGGNLMLAVDPIVSRDLTQFFETGLERMLADFGVRLDRSIIVEMERQMLPPGGGNALGPFFVIGWGDHPISSGFASGGLPLVAGEVRSVRPVSEGRATVLLRASERSYAETDLRALTDEEPGASEADIQGPVPFAVAAQVEVTAADAEDEDEDEDEDEAGEGEEESPSGGRVVVVGDATMFASEFLSESTVVNRSFLSAAIGWLTERDALIAIEARSFEARPVRMSDEDVSNLFLRVVVLIPLAFVFLGFAVWWNRKE